jgi:hypothetical protein
MSLRNHLDAEGRFQGDHLANTVQLSFNVTLGGAIVVALPPLLPELCPPCDVIFKGLKIPVKTFTFIFLFPLC